MRPWQWVAGPLSPCPLVSPQLVLRINKPTSALPFEIGCGPVFQGKGSTQKARAVQTTPGTRCCPPPMMLPSTETPGWTEVGASWAQPLGAQPPLQAPVCVYPWSQPATRKPPWAAWAVCPPACECPIQGCAKCIGSGTLADSWDPSRARRLPGQAGFTPAGELSASARHAGEGGSSQQRGQQCWGWRPQACRWGWAPPSSPARGCDEDGSPGQLCKPPGSPAHATRGRRCSHG